MPKIRPISAISYNTVTDKDISPFMAPPYDVLDEQGKNRLIEADPHNVVTIDLPHLPAKTVGPEEVYNTAGHTFRQWLHDGTLTKSTTPVLFVYQQTYTASTSPDGPVQEFKRLGLIANVGVTPFGQSIEGQGSIFPHEQTFSGPKEDRLKLMIATGAQLSPIFGLYSDVDNTIRPLLQTTVETHQPSFFGRTEHDGVLHEVWTIEDQDQIARLCNALAVLDIFIADGHHRYTTALNYRQQKIDAGKLKNSDRDHPTHYCMFVLVAMQDPGMIVLPTHRVLGGMTGFTMDRFIDASRDKLKVTRVIGKDLEALEASLSQAGPHAMGLYDATTPDAPLAVLSTLNQDPLAKLYSQQSQAWRQLDVAILQHLIVERICQPTFGPTNASITWGFPHTLDELQREVEGNKFQLGVIMQPTRLESVRQVSEAGELMPQKSTFFYPKIATGLVINPLE